MAAVPGIENGLVEEAKARDDLLDLSHSDGWSKAVFLGHGFRREAWPALASALLQQAQSAEARSVETAFGMRHIVDAPIETPDGRGPWVRSVWEVKDGVAAVGDRLPDGAGMIAEHKRAVLTRDLPEHGLVAGDYGVVVSIHTRDGESVPVGYMLEVFALNGDTIDVIDVPADAVRPAGANEIGHARAIAAE